VICRECCSCDLLNSTEADCSLDTQVETMRSTTNPPGQNLKLRNYFEKTWGFGSIWPPVEC
jgi:hypothetical protein